MKKKITIFLGIGLVSLFLFGVITSILMKQNRNRCSRYTIGIVVEKYHTMSGTFYKTKYRVDSTDYVQNFPGFGEPRPVGKKCFIKFEKGNPENAVIITEYWANPDAVAPDSGWVKIPGIPDVEQP